MRRIDISEPPVVLEGKDPVQLVKGKSVEGKSNITTDYEGFRYRFATAASKQTFLKNAAPYSVQFGGACINMGPLSGRGQPNLFEVHKERLYLFASEGCRKAFLAEPDAYIDQPDQPFTPSNEGAEKGLALLDLAAKAHGVDKLKSILRIENQAYGPADKKHRLDIATWSNFKDEFAEVQSFEGATLVTHMTPTSGWMGTLHNPDGFCDAERNYFARRNMRDIFAILRARRDKRMIVESLEKPGVITTLKEPQVLRVHLRGATTTVFINPVTHLIEGVQHQGRLMRDNYQVVRRFEDYRDVSGAKVPFKETTLWPTGQSTSVAFSKIVGNVPIDLLPVRHPLMK
jgi:YHS domain-containing protein